jgi:hypothetical protein
MLDIQIHAGKWNDGTIIGCSPNVTGNCMEPSRIVLRDIKGEYIVHLQHWPISTLASCVAMPAYTSGDYFPKSELGAVARAWDCFYDRFCDLVGREERLMGRIGSTPRDKAEPASKLRDKDRLRTEITTLGTQ